MKRNSNKNTARSVTDVRMRAACAWKKFANFVRDPSGRVTHPAPCGSSLSCRVGYPAEGSAGLARQARLYRNRKFLVKLILYGLSACYLIHRGHSVKHRNENASRCAFAPSEQKEVKQPIRIYANRKAGVASAPRRGLCADRQ